jgi:hypothetical protein
MRLNEKTLRHLRRTFRSEATRLVKRRKETLQADLQEHWRWKHWVNHGPAAVRDLLVAAALIDEVIKRGCHAEGIGPSTMERHKNKRRKRSPEQKPYMRLVQLPHTSIQ